MDFRFAVKTGHSPVPGKDVRSSLQKPFALLLMGRLSKGSQQSSRTMYRSQICSGQLLSETVEHRRLLMPDPVFGSSRLDGGGPAVRSARRPRGGSPCPPGLDDKPSDWTFLQRRQALPPCGRGRCSTPRKWPSNCSPPLPQQEGFLRCASAEPRACWLCGSVEGGSFTQLSSLLLLVRFTTCVLTTCMGVHFHR